METNPTRFLMRSDVKIRGLWLKLPVFAACFAVTLGVMAPGSGYGMCLCPVPVHAQNNVSGDGKSDRLNASLGKKMDTDDNTAVGGDKPVDRTLSFGSKDNERSKELSDLQNASRFQGAVASTRRELGSLMVTYVDGWHEQIEANLYTLADPENNIVVRRPARQEDFRRLDEVMRRTPR